MQKRKIEIEVLLSDWAGWLAMDADGEWFEFEHRPEKGTSGWFEREGRIRGILGTDDIDGLDWSSTLQKLT